MAERRMPSIDDYPSNADGYKPPAKREEVKPVVKGAVKKRKNSLRLIRDEFVGEDAPNIGSYILYDVLIPALRDLFLDIAHGSIDMAVGSGSGYRRRSSRRGGRSYVSYNRYYDDRDYDRRDRYDDDYRSRRRGVRDEFDDFIFETADDANDVLDRMCDYIDRFDDVPVSYFYDLCGQTVPHDFTKDDWGWTNLSGARVRRAHGRDGGYYIDFPKVRQL